MSKPIFNLVGLKKAYGLHVVLDDIYLSFLEGARIGVIGNNGAGKTTLLRILAGEDKEFDGVAQPADHHRTLVDAEGVTGAEHIAHDIGDRHDVDLEGLLEADRIFPPEGGRALSERGRDAFSPEQQAEVEASEALLYEILPEYAPA